MANNLPTKQKVTAVSMLAEGSSIRSIERITGIHRALNRNTKPAISRITISVSGISRSE